MRGMTNEEIEENAETMMRRVTEASRDFLSLIRTAARQGYIGDLYRTDYEVTGSDEFPVDMLRYACSFPAREIDSHEMTRDGARFVRLSRYHRDREPTLPMARFESMGWRVVRVVETVRV